jgi:hypothetical protein
MVGADRGATGGSGGLDRPLAQVIDGTRQSAGGLDEQLQGLILEGIGVDPDGAEPCGEVVARLSRIKLA